MEDELVIVDRSKEWITIQEAMLIAGVCRQKIMKDMLGAGVTLHRFAPKALMVSRQEFEQFLRGQPKKAA